ncbi:MAG TPA: hypothetical protein DIT67_00590 [Octadecabacter sp.]|nr:hypothetical protein [Octadecabacter sp.]
MANAEQRTYDEYGSKVAALLEKAMTALHELTLSMSTQQSAEDALKTLVAAEMLAMGKIETDPLKAWGPRAEILTYYSKRLSYRKGRQILQAWNKLAGIETASKPSPGERHENVRPKLRVVNSDDEQERKKNAKDKSKTKSAKDERPSIYRKIDTAIKDMSPTIDALDLNAMINRLVKTGDLDTNAASYLISEIANKTHMGKVDAKKAVKQSIADMKASKKGKKKRDKDAPPEIDFGNV